MIATLRTPLPILLLLLSVNANFIVIAKKVKIAFFINTLSVRGTEVATYDYADCNETLLGNESIIINSLMPNTITTFWDNYSDSVRQKFINRFGKRFYDVKSMKEVEKILKKEKCDIFYTQKSGAQDNKISKTCKNAMHAVFTVHPHGEAYACISEWLSSTAPSLRIPFVPYMVRLDETKETLHQELGIPEGAVVFGRHGALDMFEIDYAKEAVREIAQKYPNWYFVFLNTEKFCTLPNIIYLPKTADMVYKTKFINTCDAMVHARRAGETFGLACAEFSIKNKPIITYQHSPEAAHIAILGDKGLYYTDKKSFLALLEYVGNNIQDIRRQNWDAYSEKYNPATVMKKFDEVFIQPLIK